MTEQKRQKIKQTYKKTLQKRKQQVCKVYKVKITSNKLTDKQKNQLKMLFIEGKRFYNYILSLNKNKQIDIFNLDTTPIKEVKHYDKYKNQLISKIEYLGSSMKVGIVKNICSSLKTIKKLKQQGLQQHGELHFIKELKMIDLRQNGITHKIISKNKIKIQGISKKVKCKGLDQFINIEGIEIANAKLLNTPKGYYISFTTYIDKQLLEQETKINKTISIDFGCRTSFTTSEGQSINVKIGETERLKNLQRKLSRQVKNSNNFNKTKQLIQKEYQKIQNKKVDITNNFISKIKRYRNIVIQDQQLNNWKQLKHGKAVQYSILGRVKKKLKELPNVIIIDKFIPTTKYCYNCGNVQNQLKYYQETFKCSKCSLEEHRDIHACKNMLFFFKNIVPTEHREIKRVDFDDFFENHQNVKHEAIRSLA